MLKQIFGIDIDDDGRCIHYHSQFDIVANRCSKCLRFYACYKCHDDLETHKFEGSPISSKIPSVMCGICSKLYHYYDYSQITHCSNCKSKFNPNCIVHKDIYTKRAR